MVAFLVVATVLAIVMASVEVGALMVFGVLDVMTSVVSIDFVEAEVVEISVVKSVPVLEVVARVVSGKAAEAVVVIFSK